MDLIIDIQPQPFNTVTWYDLLLRGEQINEFAPMTETELRLKLQWDSAWDVVPVQAEQVTYSAR